MSSDFDAFIDEFSDIPTAELQRALSLASLEQRASTIASVLWTSIAADHGMNLSDFLALGVVVNRPGLTAGELGQELGLTSGSITALLDRIEHQGYVRRERSETDRRKVLVHPVHGRLDELSSEFKELTRPYVSLLASMTDEQIETVRNYLVASHEMFFALVGSRARRRTSSVSVAAAEEPQ